MGSYVYILCKLARAVGMLPPEAVAAMLLVALGATSPVAAFIGGLPFVLDAILGGLVTWYLKGLLEEHIWSELPPNHQRFLLELRNRATFKEDDRGKESSFSRTRRKRRKR